MSGEKLRDHPDRLRWNARYGASEPTFAPHPIVADAVAAGLPEGPTLELACGRSGSALALAARGRAVVAADISDVALAQLASEARQRGLADRITTILVDLPGYRPDTGQFALVLATLYWDPHAFDNACRAVAPGGLLGWEALARSGAEEVRHPEWRLPHGGLGARLPRGFTVLAEELHDSEERPSTRLLARHG